MPTAADTEPILRHLLALQMRRADRPVPSAGVRAAYLLLDYAPGAIDAEGLLITVLERLLRQISRDTEQVREAHSGRLRGRADWAATLKARNSAGGDPALLVSRAPYRAYDTPENELLKSVVVTLGRCLEQVPEPLRHGFCLAPAAPGGLLDSAARLAQMERALARLRGHIALRSIPMPTQIGEQHLRRAYSSRTEDYALVAQLYQQARAVLQPRGLGGLAGVSRRALPLPYTADITGEVYLQLAAGLLRER